MGIALKRCLAYHNDHIGAIAHLAEAGRAGAHLAHDLRCAREPLARRMVDDAVEFLGKGNGRFGAGDIGEQSADHGRPRAPQYFRRTFERISPHRLSPLRVHCHSAVLKRASQAMQPRQ